MTKDRYKRILLKISGESLMGENLFGIDVGTVDRVAREVSQVFNLGVQVCLVIGAGNIFRGLAAAAEGMDRASADYMGMLGTVMNSLAMQNSLERIDVESRVQSAITMTEICESYSRRRAIRHMEKNRVVIFAAGTGNPYFTTDTAAVLRAIEINADIVMKGTKVDGVYDKDPIINGGAIKYDEIAYSEILNKNIRVMDLTAITLCKENSLPIQVFNINNSGDLKKIILGESIGTLVGD